MQGITLPSLCLKEAVDGDQSHSALSCRLTACVEQLPIKHLTASLEVDTEKPGYVPMSAQKEVVPSPRQCSVKEGHLHLLP